jgi:hypothetical protein
VGTHPGNDGKRSLDHGINQSMDKINGKASVDGGFEGERRKLAEEIMRLSPPAPGCYERARRILERKFSLNELEVLAESLRDGIDAIVKSESAAPLIH